VDAVTDQPSAGQPTNPLFNANKLKLGVFGHNSTVFPASAAPERYTANWPGSLRIAQAADRMGLEAVVSFAGWRGSVHGDAAHDSNHELECFNWVAAVGALTSYSAVIATFHAQLMPPAYVAKSAATIDHITGGRAALNIVAGSRDIAFGQFGQELENSDTRYEHATEFMEVLQRFWSERDEFDHDGRFYKVKAGVSLPKPVQAPHPPIMNAGVSDRGKEFISRYADLAFTHFKEDPSTWPAHIDSYRQIGRQRGRDLQVWTHCYVVLRDTEQEAQDYLRYYSETHADKRWVDAWIGEISQNAPKLSDQQALRVMRNWAAGGGLAMVGTPAMVAERLAMLSDAGLSGILLTAVEPEDMLERFGRQVLPLLEARGLRQPFAARERHAVAHA
jgi:alkanesulfonate monooxygenase SsuD/methylene tetrahydromethanopterin reductase-like flavin-dependent oxidoreductase (luciferase family)